jgi:hypothetical protein
VRLVNLEGLRGMIPGQMATSYEYVICCDRNTGKLRVRGRESNKLQTEGLTPEQVFPVLMRM